MILTEIKFTLIKLFLGNGIVTKNFNIYFIS